MVTAHAATREQVLAFRLHGHGLVERRPEAEFLAAAGACGLRNTPPGSAVVGLGARVADLLPDAVDRALLTEKLLVEVLSLRASPLVVPTEDIAVFTVGALPSDEPSMRVALVNHTKDLEAAGISGLEALQLATEAAHEALANGPLARNGLSAAMTAATPESLSSFCAPCASTHIREMLFRMAGVAGGYLIVREGKETRYVRADRWLRKQPAADPQTARLELARRYLRCFGPSTPEQFAGWVGIAVPQARAAWDALSDELAEVTVRKTASLLLAADLPRLQASKLPRGVRLLPAYDAYLDQRDRAMLVPDMAHQKRLWRAIGNPGTLLVDGEIPGSWRPQKRGKRLILTVEPFAAFGPLAKSARTAIDEEAALLARMRGCTSVDVTIEGG